MTRLTQSADTYARESAPDTPFGGIDPLVIRDGGGETRIGYMWFSGVITEATDAAAILSDLHFWIGTGWTVGDELYFRRVVDPWNEVLLTYNTTPATTNTNMVTFVIADDSLFAEQTVDILDIIQDAMDAGVFYGIEITTDNAAGGEILSRDWSVVSQRPYLDFEYLTPPNPATNIRPSGNRQVSITDPRISWSTEQPQLAYQVQVDDTDNTFGSIEYDSGYTLSTDRFDPGYSGIADGETRYLRVKWWNAAGQESDWSEVAVFGRTDKETLTINSPSGDTDTPYPDVDFSLTGGTLASWQIVRVTDGEVMYSQAATDFASALYTLGDPDAIKHYLTSQTTGIYRLDVQAYDAVNRETLANDPAVYTASATFQLVDNGTPFDDVTDLSVVAGEFSGVVLNWSCATDPTWFQIRVDGQVFALIDPSDATIGGEDFEWELTSGPSGSHSYTVVALGSSVYSLIPTAQVVDVFLTGIWLISDDAQVRLRGRDTQTLPRTRNEAVYHLVGGGTVIIRTGENGREGTITGFVTTAQERDDIEDMAEAGQPVRLMLADLDIFVEMEQPVMGVTSDGFATFSIPVHEVL